MNKKLFILATAALLSVFAGCKKVEDPKDDSSTGGNGSAAPEITAIAPQSGPVGIAVVISGKNFSATDTKVLFGTAEAVISDATATTLSVVAPQNELGQVTVKVTVEGKSATAAFTYTEAEVLAPTVSDQSAAEGKAGSTLIFTGENLGTEAAAYVVKFNDIIAEITDVTADAISVKVPASDGTSSAIVTVTPVDSTTPLYEGMFTWTFSRTVALGAITGEIFEANKTLAIPVTITADEDAEELTADDVTVTFIDVNDPSKTYVATEVTVEDNGFTPIIPDKLKGEFKVKVEVAEALPVESVTTFVVYYLPQYQVKAFAGYYGRTWIKDGNLSLTGVKDADAACAGPEGLGWDRNGNLWLTTRSGTGTNEASKHTIMCMNMSDNTLKMVYKIPSAVYPYDIAFDSKGVAHVALKQGKTDICTIGKWNGTEWTTYDVTGWVTGSRSSKVQEMDLLVDDNDNLYLADRDACRIVVISNGAYVKEYSTVWEGNNIQVASIAWDQKKENIFVGADNDRVILKLNVATGALTHIAGQYGVCSITYGTNTNNTINTAEIKENKFTDGTVGNPLTATIGNISGLVCGPDGYLYFNDTHSAAVRVLIPGKNGDYTKGVVKTILGQPGIMCLTNMDGGTVNNYWYYYDGDITKAFFSQRGKLEMDSNGYLYTTGYNANTVRRITPIAE